jgi:hypothetical protein
MRCYFLARGHIRAVEILATSSDCEAISQANALLRRHQDKFDGFEIWDFARLVRPYEREAPTAAAE